MHFSVKRRYAMPRRVASTGAGWEQGAGPSPRRRTSQRALRRIAGDFAHQPWHEVARQARHERRMQCAGTVVADLEMRGSGDAVELVQVVGKDPGPEAALA